MKIAYLSFSPLLAQVANAIHVVKMCSAFSSNGHDIALYAKGSAAEADRVLADYGVARRFPVILLSTGSVQILSRLLYGFLQAYRAKSSGAPDLYYARCPASAAFALLLGGDVIFEVHEVPHKRFERFVQRSVFAHKRLRRVVVISQALLEDLQQTYPRELNQVSCIVAPDGASIATHSTSFPLQRGPGRQIGYAGGLRPGNGIQMILDLAESVRDDTFHVLGGSPEEVSGWQARQRSGNIVWYGRCNPARVPSFLAACDVLLAPYQLGPKTSSGRDTSRWMSPLKIFEYMASGTVMVVSDFPVLREVLNEDIAEIVDPTYVDAWIRSLDRLQDAAARERLAANAYREFTARYTWEARAEHVLRGTEQARPYSIPRTFGAQVSSPGSDGP